MTDPPQSYQWQPQPPRPQQPWQPPNKKRPGWLNVLFLLAGGFGVLFLFVVIVSAFGGNDDETSSAPRATTATSTPAPEYSAAAKAEFIRLVRAGDQTGLTPDDQAIVMSGQDYCEHTASEGKASADKVFNTANLSEASWRSFQSASITALCPQYLASLGAAPTAPAPPPVVQSPLRAPTTTAEAPPPPPVQTYVPPPVDVPEPDMPTVNAGSFCSPGGAVGVTAKGTPMVCAPASDGRNRWRSAG
ncbi:hypothetical protein [Aldersonia kunmingensis]|uniref:hypothetical protein n=1 Tax=Aldersonia kunmingensis TaxID=408066 RepID=UPI00082AA3B3|nr:hypothetical protein [Aldersonia kunmingensis]